MCSGNCNGCGGQGCPKSITLPQGETGATGNGIATIVDNGNGTWTVNYTNGSSQILTLPSTGLVESFIEVPETGNSIALELDANFTDASYFVPDGGDYSTLSFTSSSGASKTFIVELNYDFGTNTSSTQDIYGKSWVDGSLWTNDGATDTFVKEVKGYYAVKYTSVSTPADIEHTVYIIQASNTLKTEITLPNTHTAFVQFRSKTEGGFLRGASLHVREKQS